MKKIILLSCVILVVLFSVSCSTKRPDLTAPSDSLYTNSGKIKSQILDSYMSFINMTITAQSDYFYDSSGKIRENKGKVNGLDSGKTVYKYYGNGKLKSITGAVGSGTDNTYYSYDASNRLLTLLVVTDGQTSTKMAQTYSYDINDRISRIDEVDNGIPASYRLLNRDASGYVLSEIIYAPSTTTQFGTITYVRDDVQKTITVHMTLGTSSPYEIAIEYGYDASGFLIYQKPVMSMLTIDLTTNFILQNGPFDPAGMKGYYYTDSDLIGYTYISTYASGYTP